MAEGDVWSCVRADAMLFFPPIFVYTFCPQVSAPSQTSSGSARDQSSNAPNASLVRSTNWQTDTLCGHLRAGGLSLHFLPGRSSVLGGVLGPLTAHKCPSRTLRAYNRGRFGTVMTVTVFMCLWLVIMTVVLYLSRLVSLVRRLMPWYNSRRIRRAFQVSTILWESY